jgi:hypothetical protein
MFNKLSECQSVAQWERERNQYFHKMHLKDIKYLNSVADALQYAVKHCKEGVQRGVLQTKLVIRQRANVGNPF